MKNPHNKYIRDYDSPHSHNDTMMKPYHYGYGNLLRPNTQHKKIMKKAKEEVKLISEEVYKFGLSQIIIDLVQNHI